MINLYSVPFLGRSLYIFSINLFVICCFQLYSRKTYIKKILNIQKELHNFFSSSASLFAEGNIFEDILTSHTSGKLIWKLVKQTEFSKGEKHSARISFPNPDANRIIFLKRTAQPQPRQDPDFLNQQFVDDW